MRAVVIANGVCSADAGAVIQPDDIVIAVDGGYHHCVRWNILPHAVVGDTDSLSSEDLKAISLADIPMYRYPPRKDQTDLELALDHAVNLGADTILLLAALGARWDMTIANVMLLMSPRISGITVHIIDGSQEICLIRGGEHREFSGNTGDILSLIPLCSEAVGVCTGGLEYPLFHETLYAGSTRSISNVFCEKTVTVSLEKGFLICVIDHSQCSQCNQCDRAVMDR